MVHQSTSYPGDKLLHNKKRPRRPLFDSESRRLYWVCVCAPPPPCVFPPEFVPGIVVPCGSFTFTSIPGELVFTGETRASPGHTKRPKRIIPSKRMIAIARHAYFSAEKLRDPASAPSASGLAIGSLPDLTHRICAGVVIPHRGIDDCICHSFCG